MADVTLTAELRANIDNLERNVGTAVRTVVAGSNQIDVAANRATQALRGVNPAANSAGFALTNLGRVAQDAPFGFIGIQNNINPLIESFQRLRAESGSTSGALKALAGSLMGAGGLGLAVSVITSALTLYTMWQQKAAHAVKEHKKETDNFVEGLEAVRAATLKGAQEGAHEVTRLDILYHATQNAALSLRDRGLAYDELSDKYPKFFSNADKENTILGKNTIAYDNLKASILAMAQAKAYETRIGEESNKAFENEQRLLDLVNARSRARAEIAKLNSSQAAVLAQPNTSFKAKTIGELRGEAVAKVNEKIAKIEGYINNKLTEQSKIRANINNLVNAASTAEQQAGFKTNSDLDDKNKKLTTQKTFLQQLEAQLSQLQNAEAEWVAQGNKQDFFHQTERERAINSLIDKIAELKSATDGLDAPSIFSTNVVGNQQTGPSDFNTSNSTPQAIKSAADAMTKNLQLKKDSTDQQNDYNTALAKEAEIGKEVTKIFGGGLTDAFQSALQGTQSFVSAMGQFLVQLVTRLLAAAAAAALLAVILAATGFGPGIGGAASAAGSFKNIFGQLGGVKLAEGGITNGPTFAMIGEGREREVVAPLSKFDAMVQSRANESGGGVLTHKIQGSDLIIVLDRAQKSNKRRG